MNRKFETIGCFSDAENSIQHGYRKVAFVKFESSDRASLET